MITKLENQMGALYISQYYWDADSHPDEFESLRKED